MPFTSKIRLLLCVLPDHGTASIRTRTEYETDRQIDTNTMRMSVYLLGVCAFFTCESTHLRYGGEGDQMD